MLADDAWLQRRTHGGHTVVTIGGEIDVYSAPSFRDRMREIIDAGDADIVLDVGAVDFFDSTALGVLVGCLKHLRKSPGRYIRVASPPEGTVRHTFHVCGLDRVIACYPDTASALAGADDEQRI
ncbi:hypothetical protein BGM09_00965 [Streptomyces sp. CBMA29]|nr:hypothetical protein [Streptomyces sp. CBMA29]